MLEEFENEIKIEIAKKRYRILAFVIDFFVLGLIGMVLGYFWGTPLEDELGYSLKGIPAFCLFVFGLILWPISEGLFGQTLGKRIMKLKVISSSSSAMGLGKSFTRFFLGFIDYIFLVGLIVASTNKENKRIGDMVAKTLVVKTKK